MRAARRRTATCSTQRPPSPWSPPRSRCWTAPGRSSASRAPDSADPDWFADPVTGRRAPQRTLSFRVHHRDEAEIGNVKQIWELSRHHHLTVLAAAYWATGDERYAQTVADQLRSWWRANPFLSGVHWTSGIEVGIRLLSWVWVRRLLADWPKVGDLFENDDDALCQIAWHQEFLAAFPSRGSSANNHLIAEAAGALAAACAFAWYARSPQWRRHAADALERALAANTFASGLNREQASEYHGFVLDLALLAALEADAAGHPLSEGTWQRIAAMLDAAAAVTDVAGRPPRQGDGDEGRALVVDDPHAPSWTLTLNSGRAVLGAPPWWPAPTPSVQAVLLGALGEAGPRPTRSLSRATQPARAFADAGLVLLRSREQDGPQIWCRCDGGPHGFGAIAGHAHADALSIEVRHHGVDILADPGTYCYHGEGEWRQYFRSTAAHNTLALDGTDSSRSGGPFLWTRHATTVTTGCDTGDQPVQTWSARARRLSGAQHSAHPPSPGHPRLARAPPERGGHGRRRAPSDPTTKPTTRPRNGPLSRSPSSSPGSSDRWSRPNWTAPAPSCAGPAVAPSCTCPTRSPGPHTAASSNPIRGWYSPAFGVRVPATVLIGTGTVPTPSDWSPSCGSSTRPTRVHVSEALADTRTPAQALRRRWRLLAGAAVVGLAAGAAYLTQQPPHLASTALVLLPPPGEARGAMADAATQAQIVTSATVLGPVGAAMQPPLPVRTLERRVTREDHDRPAARDQRPRGRRRAGPGARPGGRRDATSPTCGSRRRCSPRPSLAALTSRAEGAQRPADRSGRRGRDHLDAAGDRGTRLRRGQA